MKQNNIYLQTFEPSVFAGIVYPTQFTCSLPEVLDFFITFLLYFSSFLTPLLFPLNYSLFYN